jgi:hypothetical protein
MAWQRGEPRVCAMTVPPSPIEEDSRRISRERATLLRERIQHTKPKKPEPPEPLWPDGSPYVEPVQLTLRFTD